MVEATLNRYARRFGPLKREQAELFENRLAERESRNPLPVLRALDDKCVVLNKYPTSLRIAESRQTLDAEIEAEEQGRKYSSRNDWEALKEDYKKQREAHAIKHWQELWKDEANIRGCRRLIRQIKRAIK